MSAAAGLSALLPLPAFGKMTTLHPGTCYYSPGFDYTPAGIAKIPCQTIRKFGNSGWDTRYYWKEGERVKAFIDAGKRVVGTFTMADNSQWVTTSDAEWASLIQLYVENVVKAGAHPVEIGNEVGKSQLTSYFPKLRIASEIIRAAGYHVLMSAAYPGAEYAMHAAAASVGMFDFVDGAALHPYGLTPQKCLAKVQDARRHLDSLGQSQLPLHATEYGWTTMPGHFYSVDEQTQAKNIAESFALWKAHPELKLANVLNFTFNDGGGWNYGVVREDGTHKPSYAALAAV